MVLVEIQDYQASLTTTQHPQAQLTMAQVEDTQNPTYQLDPQPQVVPTQPHSELHQIKPQYPQQTETPLPQMMLL